LDYERISNYHNCIGSFFNVYPVIADAGMYGEVYIPEHELIGFFDENGTYTIFAGIKNKEYFPIVPTVKFQFRIQMN